MKYILTIAIITILGVVSGVLYGPSIAAWDPPEECDDDQREIAGNRTTLCKIVEPVEVGDPVYQIQMYYPECVEEIVIPVSGLVLKRDGYPSVHAVRVGAGRRQTYHAHTNDSDDKLDIVDESIVWAGYRWGLESSINHSRWGQHNSYPVGHRFPVHFGIVGANGTYNLTGGRELSFPDHSGFQDLLHACLALVIQEQADRDHADQVARDEATAIAETKTQRDAAQKEEEQAQRDAESQARIAAQELAAAQESKRRVAATELLKTQTLVTQIQHEEIIAGILRDIVRIRLAGQEDRARITNEYLTRSEATAATFEDETAETETRIQAFLDFNAALLTRLDEYQSDIGARLERVRASIAEQQAEIDRLAAEAQEVTAEAEEDPDEDYATPAPDSPTPEP